jgi:hypothetical protein
MFPRHTVQSISPLTNELNSREKPHLKKPIVQTIISLESVPEQPQVFHDAVFDRHLTDISKLLGLFY